MFTEIIASHSENHIKQVSTVCEENAELFVMVR
jgi:hypothetical protein